MSHIRTLYLRPWAKTPVVGFDPEVIFFMRHIPGKSMADLYACLIYNKASSSFEEWVNVKAQSSLPNTIMLKVNYMKKRGSLS